MGAGAGDAAVSARVAVGEDGAGLGDASCGAGDATRDAGASPATLAAFCACFFLS